MGELKAFDPPANWDDFPTGPKRDRIRAVWNQAVKIWTNQSIQGGDKPLDNDRDWYYNPLVTDLSNAIDPPAVIRWTAFPNRIIVTFPNASERQHFEYAEDGPPGWSEVPGQGTYGPSGPRGYQDEYCEWSVTRDANQSITKVDFTCENPEYWEMLWRVDKNRVVELYRELTGKNVTEAELTGTDGRYNRTNQYNRDTQNGAVHLVSGPNTLGAEIYLGAAATIVRICGGQIVTDKSQLIECSRFGTPGRNSDPTIGSEVNTVIRGGGAKVSLMNPVGLYIQTPNFSTYQLPPNAPAGKTPASYWKIVRGNPRTTPNGHDQTLHAVYEVPREDGFTISDITIGGNPIQYGSQITATFQIALVGLAVSTSEPVQTPRSCIGDIGCQVVTSDDLEAIHGMFKARLSR